MLEIKDLTVHYGHVIALSGVSLEVREKEIVTLLGSNGAGKTTMLMAVSRLVPEKEGSVTFKGADITGLPPNEVVHLGISHVPEGRKIFPALTVKENLLTGSLGNKKLTKQGINDLYEQCYMLFPRLKERVNQLGGSLSGGEQQMLAIARGLMMDPDMLMLDEPSLGLAPIIVEEIFELIVKIRAAGKTILLIEQNAAMALSIADRGYVMEVGSIVLSGPCGEIMHDPKIREAYLGE
jgi:branched-chain amino acid transport system ATP-binding protein